MIFSKEREFLTITIALEGDIASFGNELSLHQSEEHTILLQTKNI